jgi:hypothetical protein
MHPVKFELVINLEIWLGAWPRSSLHLQQRAGEVFKWAPFRMAA